jgi:hypothetical protein
MIETSLGWMTAKHAFSALLPDMFPSGPGWLISKGGSLYPQCYHPVTGRDVLKKQPL